MGKTFKTDEAALSEAHGEAQDTTGLAETAKVIAGIVGTDHLAPPEAAQTPPLPAPTPEAAAPAADAAAPLWAPHEHVPHQGGSYIRQPDGSLTREEEV